MKTQETVRCALAVLICASPTFALLLPSQAQTQTEINQVAARDAAKADAAMNSVYKKLMLNLDASGKARLQRAQRAWLLFRDADADSLASQETGGTMYPAVHASFLQEITEARTKELKALAKEVLQESTGR